MADVYFDRVARKFFPPSDVVPVMDELYNECDDEGRYLNHNLYRFFSIVPLYRTGYPGAEPNSVGYECRDCGCPLGIRDPDECEYINTSNSCTDCKEP